ncbi:MULTISPECIES: AAA family ATPase [unclassified Xanthobacter]|uniref:AAA family ATPase n=1 Tax=unclassified Xanthobacter TaxID=2623496 RepID=UPI001EDD7C24
MVTSNVQKFLSGYERVESRAAIEKCFMTVEGDPGRGKTSTAEWFAIQNDLPIIRAKREWTSRWMLEDLLDCIGSEPDRTFKEMYRQAVRVLAGRSESARAAGVPYAIVIDEADHIVSSQKMMETLRDITDQVEVPVILVGMGRLNKALTRYKQISSRVSAEVSFTALTQEDTRRLIAARCESEVADDLAAHLHKTSNGFAREVLEGIGSIERVGRRLGRMVTLADMEGQVLLTDRVTGKSVTVRAD